MSFFGFQENNLEEERQRLRNGGSHENEDVAVYTWGEESYDGLGDALQEGGDDYNDETFGGAGNVGEQNYASLPGPSATFTRQGL
jgi:DNA topoisomerase 2-associated protein PAT1